MLRRCGACYGSWFLFMVPTALSVSFADSSPKGRAKGLVPACKPTDKLKFEDVIPHRCGGGDLLCGYMNTGHRLV
ncbi:MAG: hypothetical protein IKT58_03535 [Oscillospiraceae bacterium]|nr:hypothetical protein [Oscillospiraceae bacterium]